MALFPGLPGWAGTRKVKPIWILLKQETVSGSGISWAICKSAPCSRQITMPAPHHSVFYRPDALPAAQPTESKHWSNSTEGITYWIPGTTNKKLCYRKRTSRCAMSVKILSTVETSCTTNHSNGVTGLQLTRVVGLQLSRVWDKTPEGSTLTSGDIQISLQHSVG